MKMLSPELIQSIGWTLLHSLWQALAIALLLLAILRSIPSQLSKIKYGLAVASMALMFSCAVITFLVLYTAPVSSDTSVFSFSMNSLQGSEAAPSGSLWSSVSGNLNLFLAWLDGQLVWIIRIWSIGFILFILRILGGMSYIGYLRQTAAPVIGVWADRTLELATSLDISRVVRLAEAQITSPVVIGYVKPVILFPVGLISGLSTEQVEAILLHELSHVQRHDFLVNLFQSVMEAVFFFNPFVWMISSVVHKEREHCCDDAVLAHGANPLAYAKTLARLEEARITPSLAPGLLGNKNQLLNRIKRIMEKSVKKDLGRVRLVPVLLVIAGFLCASWLSIQSGSREDEKDLSFDPKKIAAADTTKKDKRNAEEKSTRYERRKITTWDESGEPHEEITESFEGDEDLRPLLAGPDVFDFPGFPDFEDFPAMPDFEFIMPELAIPDSLPRGRFHYYNDGEWETFEREFTEKFKEQFKDFYEKNQGKFDKMMEELKEKNRFDEEWSSGLDAHWADKMRMMDEQIARIAPQFEAMDMWTPEKLERQREMQEKAMRDVERALGHANRSADEQMRRHEELMKEHELSMLEQEKRMKAWESRMKEFETDVKEMLIKDGYLEKGETIEGLSFNDDGELTVNGKKIKEADRQKYRDLHRKYFKDRERFHYVE